MRALSHVEPTEREFTDQVLELLRLHGFRAVHFRPGMNRSGHWSTAGQGDVVGFPDILAVRGRRVLALELKVGKRSKPTEAQQDWLDALGHAGVEAHVVRPSQWSWLVEAVK